MSGKIFFEFQNQRIAIVLQEGNFFFKYTDIDFILKLTDNESDLFIRIAAYEKLEINKSWYISESALYELIFQASLTEHGELIYHDFKKEITSYIGQFRSEFMYRMNQQTIQTFLRKLFAIVDTNKQLIDSDDNYANKLHYLMQLNVELVGQHKLIDNFLSNEFEKINNSNETVGDYNKILIP